jgi:sporulation protein YlmC with PRC-barrel domain
MRNRSILIATLAILALLLSACGGDGGENANALGTAVPGVETTLESIPGTGGDLEPTDSIINETAVVPTLEATTELTIETPVATEQVAEAPETTPTLAATDEQSGQGGLIGIPETGSGGLTSLGAMLGFQVVDASGNVIGTVDDYVVNTCEANILYMLVEPAGGSSAGAGQLILVPYQATLETPNNGQVLAGEGQFVIDLDATALSGAPVVDTTAFDMEDPTWDVDAQAFWSEHFELALTAACPVPASDVVDGQAEGQVTPTASLDEQTTPTTDAAGLATPTAQPDDSDGETDRQNVYRVALATELLTAGLQDGNGQPLGQVVDIAIVPETGHTQFIVVELDAEDLGDSRLVALPPGALNLAYENAGQPVFVLLVETQALNDAPVFDANARTTDAGWFDYWGAFVPMTQEELP